MTHADEFTIEELEEIQVIINELANKYDSIESIEFAEECTLYAHQLPLRLRKKLLDFRNQRNELGFLLLKGFKINDEVISSTPQHWDTSWNNPNILREEIFQCLICCGLGDIFGWLTQENGRFLRHIVPIQADQDEQLGGSSRVQLLWHIEEAFHPQKADMMTIMCYRNNEKAGTTVCSLAQMDIPEDKYKVLAAPRYIIEPDKSHFPQNNKSQFWELETDHFKKIKSFLANPEPTAAIYGPPGQERMVIDEAFMHALPGDKEAEDAINWLYNHMNERKQTIEMEAGDLLLLDNRRVVHGRTPYEPNYGPKARWLRRGNITTDLAKSFEWKHQPYARTIL